MNAFSKVVHVEFLEFGSGQGLFEVNFAEKILDFDLVFVDGRKGTLGLLVFSFYFLDSPLITGEVLVVLLLEELDVVVDDSLVEVLTIEMSVTEVEMTSKTPSSMPKMDTSKVPPPRSKTRMVLSLPFFHRFPRPSRLLDFGAIKD